jgi:hypothetical protein
MNQSLETILTDIYHLDPALKAEDATVRELVTVLLAEKPLPVPDQVFVTRLRGELLQATVPKAALIPSPWWHLYLAPAGVFALLLVILIPQFLVSPTVPPTSFETTLPQATDTTGASEADVNTFQFETTVNPTDSGSAKSAVSEPMVGGRMMPEMAPEIPTPMGLLSEHGSFFVSDQLPGPSVFVEYIQVNQPVLLVVYRGSAVIGVSQIVLPQSDTSVLIPLTSPSRATETLTVAAYLDNGDAIFTPGADMVVFDVSGSPLTQSFLITAEGY